MNLFESKYYFLSVFFALIINTNITASIFSDVYTDKSNYMPGDTISFNLEVTELPNDNTITINYYHLGEIVDSTSITISTIGKISWKWVAPNDDYFGYLVLIKAKNNQLLEHQISIGVDISSNWDRFPRYGFLSDFSLLTQNDVDRVLKNLNRYHINAIQYYDWHYKHHLPVKGNPNSPDGTWPDIANRATYFSTVKRYIDTGHKYGMKSMAYNLLYGAYQDAEVDGVATQWRLFKDGNHVNPDFHDLPDSWASDIYIIDPSNTAWKNYILNKMSDVFVAFPFDGWHIDQLGNRGNRYNYGGQKVELDESFSKYLEEAKSSLNVPLIMNAVNQYGQQYIARSPVDILYTEVWDPNDKFANLISIIINNNTFSEDSLSTVLAAYVNKALSNQSGYFNTPSVLLADAVIFAAGASHLELGEHMLANEYFPNNNLKMSDELKNNLVNYYDFLVGYQNLLRDGGTFNNVYLKSLSEVSIKTFSSLGAIWNFSKIKDNKQIFHLINFVDANTLDWRDDLGNQPEPDTLKNFPVFFNTSRRVNKLWLATPDFNEGCPQPLTFHQVNDSVYFEIPQLKYWNMIVAELDDVTSVDTEKISHPKKIEIIGNYPNPFNPETNILFKINEERQVRIEIYNLLGQRIQLLANDRFNRGTHTITWKPQNSLSSGIYICRISLNGAGIDQRKLLYLK